MAKRQVFYSFHYDNDVFRVQQIRNIGALEDNKPVSANDWEKVKKGGDKAIENPNQKSACEKWQKQFGERFPCHLAKDELEEANVYEAPAIIKAPAKSA